MLELVNSQVCFEHRIRNKQGQWTINDGQYLDHMRVRWETKEKWIQNYINCYDLSDERRSNQISKKKDSNSNPFVTNNINKNHKYETILIFFLRLLL